MKVNRWKWKKKKFCLQAIAISLCWILNRNIAPHIVDWVWWGFFFLLASASFHSFQNSLALHNCTTKIKQSCQLVRFIVASDSLLFLLLYCHFYAAEPFIIHRLSIIIDIFQTLSINLIFLVLLFVGLPSEGLKMCWASGFSPTSILI